jgi:amidase
MRIALTLILLLLTACSDPPKEMDPQPPVPDPCPGSADTDHDGVCDDEDPDDDGDFVPDGEDNCPLILHNDQEDADGDGIGNVCDPCPIGQDLRDADSDGLNNCIDPCPALAGDDTDTDGDGVGDACDNCPDTPNAGQEPRACGRGTYSLVESTIDEVHAGIEAGEITCADVVEAHLDYIERHDLAAPTGPPLNAFVVLNVGARERARELDALPADERGPLHCVTVVVKDNYKTKDMQVSNGAIGWAGNQATDDAWPVARLREKGAVLLGVATMDEFASSIFAVSSRSGRTGNAYDGRRNAGGSSGGSAVAVSANFAMIGLGTDNCSSIGLPASYHGLAGLRASIGFVSIAGIFPGNPVDTASAPMARNIADMAVALETMWAPQDAAHTRPDLSGIRNPRALEGARIGVVRELARDEDPRFRYPFRGTDAHNHAVFQGAIDDMERMGATMVENVALNDLVMTRAYVGVRDEIQGWLDGIEGELTNYDDFCRSGQWSGFTFRSKEACIEQAEREQDASRKRAQLQVAELRYQNNKAHIEEVMDRLQLDALLFPVEALGPAQFSRSQCNCRVSSVSTTPTIFFQAGWSLDEPRLPIGMQLLGRWGDEPKLISYIYAYEKATGHRAAPTLQDSDVPAAPVDIEAFNARRLALGQAAFEAYLVDANHPLDLTAEEFTQLVREME